MKTILISSYWAKIKTNYIQYIFLSINFKTVWQGSRFLRCVQTESWLSGVEIGPNAHFSVRIPTRTHNHVSVIRPDRTVRNIIHTWPCVVNQLVVLVSHVHLSPSYNWDCGLAVTDDPHIKPAHSMLASDHGCGGQVAVISTALNLAEVSTQARAKGFSFCSFRI